MCAVRPPSRESEGHSTGALLPPPAGAVGVSLGVGTSPHVWVFGVFFN